MKYADLSFADPARNLACDEALLHACEALENGVLRIWEPPSYFIVVGFSNKVAQEVNVGACAAMGIPIFRRCTGGGAVLQGPGCLNYALIYPRDGTEPFRDITESYKFVLRRHQKLFETLLAQNVEIEGVSDLAIGGRKFSGNSQHRRRGSVLFQGSFLLDLDMSLVEACLRMPSKQPAYRENRPHRAFMKNLPLDANRVKEVIVAGWGANTPLNDVPWITIDALVHERYSRDDWNLKF